MSRLQRALLAAVDALTRSSFALVGGVAVSARTEPRFTRDLDLAVAALDDAIAEDLVRSMTARGFRIAAVVEQEAVGRLATARLVAPGEPDTGVLVDLLFASSGIEVEIARHAEPLEVFSGVIAPVARTGHLIALKLLSRDDVRRPLDAADLRALLGVASERDLSLARESIELITDRGFSRGRDLVAAFDSLVAAG